MRVANRAARILRSGRRWAVVLSCSVAWAAPARAEAPAGTVEPIYRVAREAGAAPSQPAPSQPAPSQPAPTQVAARVAPAAGGAPFNLAQRPGEHPLMPALRVAEDGLKHIDASIKDYQALLYKQERIDGELQPQEVAYVKVRHQPFSVHMFFLSPNRGRECVYSDGPGGVKGQLHARDSGIRRRFGVWPLDPEGSLAMKGQKYPIMKLGVRALTTELVTVASNDVKFGECEVVTSQTVLGPKDGEKRPVTLIQVTHPTRRDNFRFHKAEVFIDNELRVPIRYAAYLWPENAGEAPPLEETYTYVNLKVNNGFTDADFDPENRALLFKD